MAKPVREATKSVWMETAEVPRHQSLAKDREADVCVVGAGIAGLTTAYLLAREGKSVVVLDDGPIAGGQTQRTSAHLSNAIDDRYIEIEKVHGDEGSRLAAESHTAAIDRIEAIAHDEGIDCDFRPRRRLPVPGPGQSAGPAGAGTRGRPPRRPDGRRLRAAGPAVLVRHRAAASASRARASSTRSSTSPGWRRPSGRRAGRSTPIPMHRRSTAGRGSRWRPGPARSSTAAAVVVATNTPINDLVAIHTKQAPYLTYAIGAPRAARLGRAGALLGHAGRVSLHPAAADEAAATC